MQPIGNRSLLGLNTSSEETPEAPARTPSLKERGQQLVAGALLATIPTGMLPATSSASVVPTHTRYVEDVMEPTAARPALGKPIRINENLTLEFEQRRDPRAPSLALAANGASQSMRAEDLQDTLAAADVRDRVMHVFQTEGSSQDKDWAERYFRESDPERKAILFSSALSNRFLQDQNLLPSSRNRMAGTNFWKALFTIIGSQFLPGDTSALIARMNPQSAPLDPFAFNLEQSDIRAKIGHQVAQNIIRIYLGSAQADSYQTDTPLVQTQNYLQATRNMQESQRWPNAGIIYLTDIPSVQASNGGPLRKGTYGKQLVGLFLGTNSPEYKNWDNDTSERRRGEAVSKAIESLLLRGQILVADQPQLSVNEFKDQVQFRRWVYNADDDERTVAEAYGKEGLQRFRELASEYQRSGSNMDPGRLVELTDLYRASVARMPIQHFAFYLVF